jgi:hypothetical protein
VVVGVVAFAFGIEMRLARAQLAASIPSLLLGRDIHVMQTKACIERAVVDVLRNNPWSRQTAMVAGVSVRAPGNRASSRKR